jgi:hypothetical protein
MVSEYLRSGKESLYHNIIENGDEFVEELGTRFETERSQDARLSIIL